MTTFGKVGLVIASVGTIGTATTYGLYEFNRETIGDNLKGTLLTSSEEDKPKWKERSTNLKQDQEVVSENLKAIKDALKNDVKLPSKNHSKEIKIQNS